MQPDLEWRRTWRASSSATRRRIRRAYWRGEALDDPQLAALAIGYAESAWSPIGSASVERPSWLVAVAIFVVAVVMIVLSVTDDGIRAARFVPAVLGLLLALAVLVFVPRLERKRRRFEQANREAL